MTDGLPRFDRLRQQVQESLERVRTSGSALRVAPLGFDRRDVATEEGLEGGEWKRRMTDELQNVADLVAPCTRCRLGALRQGRGGRAVPGEGRVAPLLLAMGDRPGRAEDQTGRPMVGPASRVFGQILGFLGLDRQRDVFIANATKCAPPGTPANPDTPREPTKEEWCICSSLYLHRQILACRPWVILVFGNVAFEALMQTRPMADPTIQDCRSDYTADFASFGNRFLEYPHDPRIRVWWARHYAALARSPNTRLSYAEDLEPLRLGIAQARQRLGI